MPKGSYDPDWTPEDGDDFGEPSDDDLENIEREEQEFDTNMGEILRFYEEESAEFNQLEEEFFERYGFVHKCRCDKDWEEGNLGVVSVCYLNMASDAMDTLEATQEELRTAKRELAKLRIENA